MVAKGEATCANGGGFYPVICDGAPTKETCTQVGLIKCDSDLGCPSFFQVGAEVHDDKVSGGVCFFIAIVILFICLGALVSILQRMLMGVSTRIIHKATNMNGYVAMAVGTGLTILVQSSSITTSVLTPIVGLGAIRLEQMYPLTLGYVFKTLCCSCLSTVPFWDAHHSHAYFFSCLSYIFQGKHWYHRHCFACCHGVRLDSLASGRSCALVLQLGTILFSRRKNCCYFLLYLIFSFAPINLCRLELSSSTQFPT